MAFNLKQNPVMMMGKHTSCQFSAGAHFTICRLPIRFQETIFSKPLYFTQPNFLIGLTGLSPGSGTRTWRAGGRSSWGRWSRTRRSFSSSSRGPTGRGASRRWTRFWTDSKLFQSGPEKVIYFRRNYSQVKWLVPHTMTVMELARLLKQRLKVAPRIDILLLVRHFDIFKLTPFQKQFGWFWFDLEPSVLFQTNLLNQVNGDTMPALLKQMGELHAQFANPDGFLYFNFFSQETLG